MTAKKSKRKQRPSKADRRQAQRIHEHTVFRDVLSRNLIRRFARRIDDESVRGALLFDYGRIAKILGVGDPETTGGSLNWPQLGVWERYAHHFQNQKTRRNFFAEIDRIAKRYVADIVFCHAVAALHNTKVELPELLWNETLLHPETAPHVLRQWISDRATTEKFITALFQHLAHLSRKGSTARRAMIAADAADESGWKPLKITEVLVQTGNINLGQHEYQADEKLVLDRAASTVGRSIRRMRKADKERRTKMNADKRRQKAADRAAEKRARLKRGMVEKEIAARSSIGSTPQVTSTKPTDPNNRQASVAPADVKAAQSI
jgi:hypothetical protein